LCGGHAQCVSVCSTGAIQLFDKGRAKDDWRRTIDPPTEVFENVAVYIKYRGWMDSILILNIDRIYGIIWRFWIPGFRMKSWKNPIDPVK
jgi:ferredoxin